MSDLSDDMAVNQALYYADRVCVALERIAATHERQVEALERAAIAQERLADAGEAANANDPLLALQRAMEAPPDDPDADMPPHIRRAAGRG